MKWAKRENIQFEDHNVPVTVVFPKDNEKVEGKAYFSKSKKSCSVAWDDTSYDKFMLNFDGSWRCMETDQKRCKIEIQN